MQRCLAEGQLETAASYIIILQNLERTIISRQHATLLLDSALVAGCWQLAKDLLRFLRAIDPYDAETPPAKTSFVGPNASSHTYTMKYVIAPSSLGGDSVADGFQVQPQQGSFFYNILYYYEKIINLFATSISMKLVMINCKYIFVNIIFYYK